MRTFLLQIFTGFKNSRSIELGRLVAITGSTQALIQLIGFVSGILIIRFLPTREYALYTMAVAIYTNMVILADSGIKTSVMAQAGKVWQDKYDMGKVISTGFHLRKLFAIGSIIISIPIMLILLHHHGATWWMASGITLAILPAFYANLSGTIWEIVPKLHQSIFKLQKIELIASIIRAVFIGVILYFFPYTMVALIAFGFSQVWANKKLRNLADEFIVTTKKKSLKVRGEILKMVKRLLPDSIYLCISGQITVWLISIFGTTVAVAQVGAMGRLAMILGFFGVMFGSLVSPRFSRLVNDKKLILKRFGQIQIGLLVLGLFIVTCTWIFAKEMLWLLGEGYSNLEFEILLLMIGNFIGFVATSNFYLYTSRGWVINPLISIPVSMTAIVCGAFLFDVSSLKGILIFNIFNNVVILVLHTVYGYLRIMNIQDSTERITY